MNDPMLVKSTYGWHVVSEDGQKFDLIPQECSVRYNGAGLTGIRGTRADIELVQHWQNEAIRAEYLAKRLDLWLNEAQRLALLVRQLGGDPEPTTLPPNPPPALLGALETG